MENWMIVDHGLLATFSIVHRPSSMVHRQFIQNLEHIMPQQLGLNPRFEIW